MTKALWPELLPKAAQLRRQGLSNTEIAEQLGIHPRTPYQWMGPQPRRYGGTAVYPPEAHSRARYLRTAGYSITEISLEMKINRSTVGRWVEGMPCD